MKTKKLKRIQLFVPILAALVVPTVFWLGGLDIFIRSTNLDHVFGMIMCSFWTAVVVGTSITMTQEMSD